MNTSSDCPIAPLPVAVWSGKMRIGEISLTCHVLDDGRRIIEQDSVVRLLDYFAAGGRFSDDDALQLAEFIRGPGGPDRG